MWKFVVTFQFDRQCADGGRVYSMQQTDFMASNYRKLFNLILDRMEDHEDENLFVDVLNITQVM